MTAETDLISRQAAIDTVVFECGKWTGLAKEISKQLMQLPSAQPDLTYIIFETLAECGIYGEEATIKLIGTLKRLGRNDLLPPCVR